MFRYRSDHPYRPLHWRWERARIRQEYGRAAPGRLRDDKWTTTAAIFRTAKDNCKNEVELYQLYDKYPEISMAYELWDEDAVSSIGKANSMRHEIEARMLAGETAEEIAKKVGTKTEVIQWYESLFFNVKDRLKNKMYIFHMAIGDSIQRGLTDRDYAVLWKMYAYVRGSAMLDFLITTFSDWSKPTPEQVESALTDDHKTTMKRKAALASRMMGINHHSSDRLIELQTKIVEVERASAEGASVDGIQQNIQVMLNHLPLLVGHQGDKLAGNLMSRFQSAAVDLRSDELLKLSAGQPIDIDAIEEHKFPELPRHEPEAE